jgi:cell wall assembly regulator SMI1
MLTEGKVQRIGGSTFVRLPPAVVKSLGLHDGDDVQVNIVKEGKTLGELLDWFKDNPLPDDMKAGLKDWKRDRGVLSKYD